MYFIRDGSASLSIGQLLERKAAEGVRIKVLGWDMDVMGFNPVVWQEANLPGRTGVANRNQDQTPG
jgi:phosphatidylserine/phosphatidylglycerophosphate/cardiolipin synthase-like enzyme